MMTKRSRWIAQLVLWICLCMLLVSCAPNFSGGNLPEESAPSVETEPIPDDPSEEEEEERIPENQTVVYRAIAEEWSKYLTYKAPTVEKPLTATLVYEERENEEIGNRYGVFLLTKETSYDWENLVEVYTQRIYNVTTGQTVIPDLVSEDRPDAVQYGIYVYDAVVGVVTETPVLDEQGNVRRHTYVYDYYDANGKKLNEEPIAAEVPVINEVQHGEYTYATVCDVCIVSREGEILFTFPVGKERQLPVFDRVYGDFGYVLGQKQVHIVHQNGEIAASYELSRSFARENVSFTVLSDGSLLIQYLQSCYDHEELYTVKDAYGTKYLISYVVLDPVSGEASEIPVQFLINRLATNAENDGLGLTVAGDYQYAEIVRIKDGELSDSTVPVILDGKLNVVKELPLILKNQVSMVRAASDRFWILRVRAVNSKYPHTSVTYYYSVDTGVGTVALYADTDSSEYEKVDGGFIFKDGLYNDMMVKQMDLSDVDSYQVLDNGRLLVDLWQDNAPVTMLVYLENHQLKTCVLGDINDQVTLLPAMKNSFRVDVYDDDGIFQCVELRNADGSRILSGDSFGLVFSREGFYVIRCYKEGKRCFYAVSSEKGIENEK